MKQIEPEFTPNYCKVERFESVVENESISNRITYPKLKGAEYNSAIAVATFRTNSIQLFISSDYQCLFLKRFTLNGRNPEWFSTNIIFKLYVNS